MCNVIYEDNHLLVVEKPPNLLTQGDATGDECLLDKMKRYLKAKYAKPGEVYLGCVHRLDRPVGGLVALARTSKAASRLSEQLRAHAMQREYLAVVDCTVFPRGGAPLGEAGMLRDALLKEDATGNVRCVPQGTLGSQEAALHYQRLAADPRGGTALMHIRLETGRKHQIRVQLSHAGYPIVQDLRYGHGEPGEPIALWGAVLRLTHPTKQTPMTFISSPKGKAFDPYAEVIGAFLAAQNAAPAPVES
ncbi:MAG TPA: RluA family pseudouridine synthase [Candidatus Limiplasma sp.]|nr:RluA family pseudouridine synthase [Candidatus Limiplasma sp.]HPS81099.1 RluA family pseudouridine synthase [Candidatus Limiplasma sp.]